MPLGPLQVMVVNFEDTNFTGEIEAELIRLEETGTLRVLDVIFVAKSLDGEIEVVRTDDVHDGALSRAILGLSDDAPERIAAAEDADVWYAADAIEPGNAAGIMVLEHRWSIPLREAIVAAGGRNVVTEWVDEAEVAGLGVALPAD
ncbi:MAG TPA: DUF6325 family protein [Solirubrobacter sp.]